MIWLMTLVFMVSVALADAGKVLKMVGENNAYIIRNKNQMPLKMDDSFEIGDEVHSENSVILVHLYPGTQMSLAKNTQIKISEDLKNPTIGFTKGLIRLQVVKMPNQKTNQKVQADGVAFIVHGTEFEVSLEDNKDVNLDVLEGEVEVRSPYIQTFVPEIVKAKEGFRYLYKERNFSRRGFAPKFLNHPEFLSRTEMSKRWELKKKKLNSKKKK